MKKEINELVLKIELARKAINEGEKSFNKLNLLISEEFSKRWKAKFPNKDIAKVCLSDARWESDEWEGSGITIYESEIPIKELRVFVKEFSTEVAPCYIYKWYSKIEKE
jgi:hypothetical protein